MCSLQRNKLSTDGVLIKAQDGVYANLRWDLGVSSYDFYWDMQNHKSETNENFQRLADFARGIAGGSGIPRAAYIFDNVNLPEVSYRHILDKLMGGAGVRDNWGEGGWEGAGRLWGHHPWS